LLGAAFSKIFGTKVERELKRMRPVLEQMNALEPEMQRASDAELRAKSEQFRRRIQERLAALPTDEQDPAAAEKLQRATLKSCPRPSPSSARLAVAH